MRDLWLTIAHTSAAKIIGLVLGVIALSLTARLLGPEGRGQVVVITAWVQLFCTFAYLSLGQVALHRMRYDTQRENLGALLGSLLFLAAVLTLVGWSVAWGLYAYFPQGVFKELPALALLVGFLALPFMIWEQYVSSLLMGLERIKLYNAYLVIGRTLAVISLIVLVAVLGMGVPGALVSTLLGQIVVAMGGMGFLLRQIAQTGSTCRPSSTEIKALLSGGLKLHLNAIGTFLFTTASVLILNHYHGAEQTSYFQLATQILSVLMIIPQSASMVIFGKVATLGPDAAWPYNKRLLYQTTAVMAAMGAAAAYFAPWLITLIAGDAFRPAIEPFQWMVLGLIGMTFSAVMAPQWIGRGFFWQAAGITFLVGLISFTASLWLIPELGILGAVYAFLLTYFAAFLTNSAMMLYCEKRNATTS